MASTASSQLFNVTTMNTTAWLQADEDEDSETGRHHVYVLLVVYPLVFLFGVFGNTLVITVVLKYHQSLVYIA